MPDAQRVKLTAWLLAALTLVLFWPATHFAFLVYDDKSYVMENPAIQGGVTIEALAWAFTTRYVSNWHPVTWISHMLDCEVYGPNPAGHHLTNLLLHAANVALLFLLLYEMTRGLWRSALVAALFAWHPLHVESVAWVAERKDVLSTFFGLLTLWTYTRYVTESSGSGPLVASREGVPPPPGSRTRVREARTAYVMALVFYALSLMSKATLVTLPFLLLLLDYWPLSRVAGSQTENASAQRSWSLRWLLLEKTPFLALALLCCTATLWAQKASGAVVTLGNLPLSSRVANALVSYSLYVWKMLWPANLAPFYPYRDEQTAAAVVASSLLLVTITFGVIRFARREPWLAVGWFWFLGALVPVIGLVQVGTQAMADRYDYVPSIGIFIMIAWALAEWVRAKPDLRQPVCCGVALWLAALALCTRHQLQYWHDSITLFNHALKVTPDNILAEGDLGVAYDMAGDKDQAIVHYQRSLAIPLRRVDTLNNARYAAHYNLGVIFASQHKMDQAEAEFRTALREKPDLWRAHRDLGALLLDSGRFADASAELQPLVQGQPDNPELQQRLGEALAGEGRSEDGLKALQEAVRLGPGRPAALGALAWFLATDPHPELRNGDQALQLAQDACEKSHWLDARCSAALDVAYAEVGRFDDAITAAEQTRTLAQGAGQTILAVQAAQRLQLYRQHRSYHQIFHQ